MPFPRTACLSFFSAGFAYSADLSSTPVEKQTGVIGNTEKVKDDHQLVELLFGQPAQNSVYIGMWSYHVFNDDASYQSTHNLIGLTYNGFFVGTFENSRDERALAAGFQRDVFCTTFDVLTIEVGYRVGLMHGYE